MIRIITDTDTTDPVTGRWPSIDPLGEKAFFEIHAKTLKRYQLSKYKAEALKMPYRYLDNNSITLIDINGLIYKKCGSTATRSLELAQGLYEEAVSAIIARHIYIVTDDNDILDPFGSGEDGDHWTKARSPIFILSCMDCGKFSECLKRQMSPKVCGTHRLLFNNCQTVASNAIATCFREQFSWSLYWKSIKGCCD